MCQNRPDDRIDQSNAQRTPGRDDLDRDQQPDFKQGQATTPGRHEDDEDQDGNRPRRDIDNTPARDRAGAGETGGDEMNPD